MEWFLKVVRDNYANFNGRARRKEYWMFFLINMIISMTLYGLAIIGTLSEIRILSTIGFGLYGLYTLAMLIPSLAVGIRRLHDTGRSGWWLLIGFVPLIGAIVMLIFTVQEGDPCPNEYGEDPKADERFV